MKLEDKIRIQHMLDAANEALAFASDVTEKDFSTDRMLI